MAAEGEARRELALFPLTQLPHHKLLPVALHQLLSQGWSLGL